MTRDLDASKTKMRCLFCDHLEVLLKYNTNKINVFPVFFILQWLCIVYKIQNRAVLTTDIRLTIYLTHTIYLILLFLFLF